MNFNIFEVGQFKIQNTGSCVVFNGLRGIISFEQRMRKFQTGKVGRAKDFGSLFSGSPTGDRALEPVEVPRKVGCRRRGATCVALSTKGKGSRSYTG